MEPNNKPTNWYMTLNELAERWETTPEAIVHFAAEGSLPQPNHPYGWHVTDVLLFEMYSTPEWPDCIETLSTARAIGLNTRTLKAYKGLVFRHISDWFGETDKYAEALSIYREAIGEVNA